MTGRFFLFRLAAAAFFCSGLFYITSCGNRAHESNEELIRQAVKAVTGERADWRKAKTLVNAAVKQNPKDANAHVMLALALEQSGQKESALDEIKKAVDLDSRNFLALFTKGRMLFENEKIGECISPLREAFRLRPDNENALLLLARSSFNLGLLRDAAAYYAALARHPRYKNRVEPFNELGIIYVKLGDYRKAAMYFSEAYKKCKDNHIVLLNLAIFCDFYIKNPANAIKLYNRYQEVTLRNPELEPKRIKIANRIEKLNRQTAYYIERQK